MLRQLISNQYKKDVYLLEIQTQDGKINNKLILFKYIFYKINIL